MVRTIDPRYVPQTVTVAPNVSSTNPTPFATTLGQVTLEEVQLFVPPGHGGVTGLAIMLAGVHIVPYGPDTGFIIADSATLDFQLGIEVDQGLVVVAYNTDIAFAHSFYLRWKISSIAGTDNGSISTVTQPVPMPIVQSVGP